MPATYELSESRHSRNKTTTPRGFFKELGSFWKTIILIGTPLVLLPWPLVYPASTEAKCAYGLIIMAVYWMTEVIPLAVTSLLPVILFPLMGVMKSADVCINYMKDVNMLFIGGLMVAVAVEKSNLHKRIALRVLMLVGSKPRWLMLGFMLPTWFLSMWISNTATTAMMIPIVQAVLDQLKNTSESADHPIEKEVDDNVNGKPGVLNQGYNSDNEEGVEMAVIKAQDIEATSGPQDATQNYGWDDKQYKKMCKGMSLCICYAASVGGISTLTGTGPNLVLKGQADILFEKYGETSGLNFSTWMIFGLPISAISLFLAWIWLQLVYFGCCKSDECGCCGNSSGNSSRDEAVKNVIRKQYHALGPMRFNEVAVLCHFVLLALLWLSREPEFIDGWSWFFLPKYVTDATPAIFIAISLFMFPAQRPSIFCCRAKNDHSKPGPKPSLLDWDTVTHKLPWSVVLLLGGGFALADACQKSGFSKWIGDQLVVFAILPPWAMVMLITLLTAAATEVTSNSATATLLLPILGQLAINIEVNPLYLMFPACLATSFAFMLPVATPPNAIVFAYGHLKVIDMASVGIVMNIICVLVVTLGVETWGKAFFNLGVVPAGFLTNGMTTAVMNITTTINP